MSDRHGELILYRTDDGRTDVHLRAEDGTVWLSQAELADLFETTPQNITQHIRAVYEEAELDEAATCKDYLQVRREGKREVRRSVKTYRLELILAVGFRVRSPRGAQFRRWAEMQRDVLPKRWRPNATPSWICGTSVLKQNAWLLARNPTDPPSSLIHSVPRTSPQ